MIDDDKKWSLIPMIISLKMPSEEEEDEEK